MIQTILISVMTTATIWIILFGVLWLDYRRQFKRGMFKPDELRIKEEVEEGEDPEDPMRIEYAYGCVKANDVLVDIEERILIRSSDFWMPLERAKEIRDWLDDAINYVESGK